MKWLRSEEMEYVSLIVNEDVAHNCIQRLGLLGVVQFKDLNEELTPFQRRYVSNIKRCDELERKIRYFTSEVQKFNIKVQNAGTVENFVKQSSDLRGGQSSANAYLETLEHMLEDKETELLQLDSFHEKLTREYNEKKEYQEVLAKALDFMSSEVPAEISPSGAVRTRLLDDEEDSKGVSDAERREQMRFSNLMGAIAAEERVRFERMVFRATRGNCYVRFAEVLEPIVDPTTNQKQQIDIFIIFYKSSAIETKLRKICDAFKARIYTVPDIDNRAEIESLIQNNNVELGQASHILRKNRESCVLLCREIAQNLENWRWTVIQEKATYHTLNMLKADVSGMLRGEGWVIKSALNDVRYEVSKAHSTTDKSMPSLVDQLPKPWPVAPTHFQTNKFTQVFQDFVDTYGVPRYREINPAVFTAVTFPFLFGIMYGDMGHGTILFIQGLYLVLTEKRLESGNLGEMESMLYGGRYMLTLMGLFAMYCGLIYNDCFALGLNLFGSRWLYPTNEEGEVICHELLAEHKDCVAKPKYEPASNPQNVYPVGADPVWHTSQNELLFFNSMKMKMSVIIGILQMTFGIIIKGWNAVYFRQWYDFFFDFLPQLVFDAALFLYMVFLIFYKWSVDWNYRMGLAYKVTEEGVTKTVCPLEYGGVSGGGCQPPSLINTLISIVLTPGEVADPMFANQDRLQRGLLTIAFLCIPVMLLVKPFLLRWEHSKKKRRFVDSAVDEHDVSHASGGHGHGHGEFEFGEVMIHQGIETIEFVLGMVSNTASYLRLWALSLAHSELATVFWEKAMVAGINTGNPLFVFIAFAVFAGITFGVLLSMDVLECFLHALRLHWVEFQNKFYKADGTKFAPLSFAAIIKERQHA